jgi:ion channel
MTGNEVDRQPPTREHRHLLKKLGETRRFGIVLVLLVVTFVLLVSGATGTWMRLTLVVLQAATFVIALSAADMHRHIQRIGRVIALLCVLIACVTIPFSGHTPTVTLAVESGLLVAGAPVAIAWSIVRHHVIDQRTVLAAICIYVLIGLFFAFLYTTIGAIQNQPFFVQTQHATSSEYVYFSFVTLTTVGYGDFTAAAHVGRALAVLEALFGQIYLVTIVALLVSNLGWSRQKPSEE